jgi:hypothetical protein
MGMQACYLPIGFQCEQSESHTFKTSNVCNWHDPEIQHRNYAALNQTLVTLGFWPNVAYQPNRVTGDSRAAAIQIPDDHNCQGRYTLYDHSSNLFKIT